MLVHVVGEVPRQAEAVRELYVNANAYDIACNAKTIASTTQKCAQADLKKPTHNLLASIALVDLCCVRPSKRARATRGFSSCSKLWHCKQHHRRSHNNPRVAKASPKHPTIACHNLLASIVLVGPCCGRCPETSPSCS